MNTALGIVSGLVVGAAIGAGAATLYKGKMPGMGGSTGGGASVASSDALIELDGKAYTEADLPGDVRAQIFEARSQSHERMSNLLTQFALQMSLAKDKGVDVKGALPAFETLVDVPAPTEAEMQALFDANKARLPPDTTFDKIKPDIERYVKNQKMGEVLRTKNDEFKAANRMKLLVTAPQAPKVELDLAPYLAKGTGPTLVEVADYLCPHCQATQPEVEAMMKDMGDKVKIVAVPFSLNPDALSGSLARGAFCARQQSDESFWKYHEAAFRTARAKQWKPTDPAAKEPVVEVAKEAGLDTTKLEACVDGPEAIAFVKKTVDSFNQAGVSGTPTFFFDGRRIQPQGSLRETVTGLLTASSH